MKMNSDLSESGISSFDIEETYCLDSNEFSNVFLLDLANF